MKLLDETRNCKVCRTVFEPKRKAHIFCSRRCKNAWNSNERAKAIKAFRAAKRRK